MHGQMLQEHVSKLKTLDMFFLRHQQNKEYEAFPPDQFSSGGPIQQRAGAKMTRPTRTRSPGREDSDDDESYFESEDDETVPDAPERTDTVSIAEAEASNTNEHDEGTNDLAAVGAHSKDASLVA